MKNIFLLGCLLVLISSCTVSKYSPTRKFGPKELQEDYALFRNILEESHPSLYWYTSKDSMDHYFEAGAAQLKDSMAEYQFRNVLSYVVAQMRCGHSSVRASKDALRYSQRVRSMAFPLSVKLWPDTVLVTGNMNRRDSNITRGVILKSIDDHPIETIVDTMFRYLTADGYNTTHKYQTLSNPNVFRSYYGYIYGLKPRIKVGFIDTLGRERTAMLSLYNPGSDTPRAPRPPVHLPSRREIKRFNLQSQRSLRIDTSLHTAFLEVNSFSKNLKLRRFFRQSFRRMRKEHIPNLVVDMRGNGGGSVTLSNLLTKYIADKPFKIADSLYAQRRGSNYASYQQSYLLNHLFLLFMTHKRADGHYHFSLYENKYFSPKKTNHFNGTTYILTGGNTFSAASLFAHALRDQEDVIVVGEETGGGAYGNTAWLIPDVTLPNTKVRFRLPLFRLVIDTNQVKGRGVMPEVESLPTLEAIRKNKDYKMEKVKELIRGF